MQMPIKLQYQNKIHLYNGKYTLQAITQHVFTVFKLSVSFQLMYDNSIGQPISIDDDCDLMSLKYLSSCITKLRVQIQEKRPNYAEGIKTITLREYMNQQTKIQSQKLEKAEEKATDDYLAQMNEEIVQQQAVRDQDIVQQAVSQYLHFLSNQLAMSTVTMPSFERKNNSIIASEQNKVSAKGQSTQTTIPSLNQIQELVEKKVNQLLPSLVEKACQQIQYKSSKCDQCAQRQREIDHFIFRVKNFE